MTQTIQDKNAAKFYLNKGKENEAKYLHIKHRYGWLDNFGALYNGFIQKAKEKEVKVTYENLESFFSIFTEAMDLKPEFRERVIDDRKFSLTISPKADQDCIIYDLLSAGQLLDICPMMIQIIELPDFQNMTFDTTDTTYILTLKA